jgi:hypothetical protein
LNIVGSRILRSGTLPGSFDTETRASREQGGMGGGKTKRVSLTTGSVAGKEKSRKNRADFVSDAIFRPAEGDPAGRFLDQSLTFAGWHQSGGHHPAGHFIRAHMHS